MILMGENPLLSQSPSLRPAPYKQQIFNSYIGMLQDYACSIPVLTVLTTRRCKFRNKHISFCSGSEHFFVITDSKFTNGSGPRIE